MRYLGLFILLCGFHPAAPPHLYAQQVTPVVPFGGTYEMPEAIVTPDPTLDYRLVIDVVTSSEVPDRVSQGLHNVARMLNLPLLTALREAGVRVTVCGQSLKGRNLALDAVAPEVAIATSMLTTVAMYQMRGYGMLRF